MTVNTNLITGTRYGELLLRQRIKRCLGSIVVASPFFTLHKQSSPFLRSPPFPRMHKRPYGNSPLPGQKWASTLNTGCLHWKQVTVMPVKQRRVLWNFAYYFTACIGHHRCWNLTTATWGKCCICEQEFEKKRKGFKRCKVTTLGEPSTLNVYHPPWTKPHLKLLRTIYVSPASTRTTEKPFLPPDARRGIKRKLPPNGTLPEEKEKKMRKGMKSSFNTSTHKTYKTNLT